MAQAQPILSHKSVDELKQRSDAKRAAAEKTERAELAACRTYNVTT